MNEERLQFLITLNDRLRPLSDPVEIQDVAARLLGDYLRVNRVVYGDIDGDEFIVGRTYTSGVTPFSGRSRVAAFGAVLVDAFMRGQTVAVDDVGTDDRLGDDERALFSRNEIASMVVTTLHKDGRWLAGFGIHSATPRRWTRDEITLVEATAERTWAAAERARAEDALRNSEERHAFLLTLADALRPLSDSGEVQETAARLLGEHLGVNRVGYAEIEDGRYVIRREYARGVAPLVGNGPSGTFGAALRDAYRRGDVVVVNDVAADPRFTEDERGVMRGRQIAAFVGATLVKNGRLLAAFGANNATRRDWTPTEVALVRDVAERTWDAVERARAEAALRGREQRYRLALEASAGGSWTWDSRSNHVDWDDTFRARYGFALEEVPSFEAWLARVHEDDRQRLLGLLSEVLQTAGRDEWDSTFRIVRPDGTVLWMQSRGRPERDAAGQVTRLTGLEMDITERRRAEAAAALEERTAALEHRTAQLSRLASDLTLAEHHAREQLARTLHDGLQQLLLVAAVNLDQHLKRDEHLGSAPDQPVMEARRSLDEAMAAARSLSIELYPPALQSSGLAAALTWLAGQTAEKYGLTVTVSADPRANSTRKDIRTLLFESVRELLVNAVKHARVDQVAIDLALDAEEALCITVTDKGVGFDAAALVDRAKTARVGWGLFSIHERLTLLGGRFEIESVPGQGTVFRLIAPRGAGPESAESTAGTATLPPLPVLRILIVDDHPSVRDAYRKLLHARSEFVVVGEAADGLEAIVQARALRPDVILMDISMPRMDGIEATRRLRAEMPGIPILGMSSQSRMDVVHPIEEAGAAGYFIKGLDTERMIDHMLRIHAGIAGLPAPSA